MVEYELVKEQIAERNRRKSEHDANRDAARNAEKRRRDKENAIKQAQQAAKRDAIAKREAEMTAARRAQGEAQEAEKIIEDIIKQFQSLDLECYILLVNSKLYQGLHEEAYKLVSINGNDYHKWKGYKGDIFEIFKIHTTIIVCLYLKQIFFI